MKFVDLFAIINIIFFDESFLILKKNPEENPRENFIHETVPKILDY